jgi:oligopeptide/dipeptide ABC transporter ATP-binding protein
MEDLLRVERLTNHIFTGSGVVRAVEDVSLLVRYGEAIGLVGESGCGKSTFALSLMRLIPKSARIMTGRVLFKGNDLLLLTGSEMHRVRGCELAMVFQDPMTYLNPLMRVSEQIVEAIRLHQRVGSRQARQIALETLRLVRMPTPETIIDAYPHQLSGGMRQRVLIAIAISCRPALLIADEPTTAVDVTVQAQIMKLLADLRQELGIAMLLITHDLGLVAEHCDRVYVMYAGQIVEEGGIFGLFARPQHPYTQALLESSLSVDHRVDFFKTIDGQPPSLVTPLPGCRFHPRCEYVMTKCRTTEPPIVHDGDSGWARCWLLDGSDA